MTIQNAVSRLAMKGADRLAAAVEDLAEKIRGNTEMMQTLRESIDDVRTEIEHALRNGRAVLDTPEKLVESVSCAHCDAGADSLQEAVRDGWRDLEQDADGLSYNFIAVCPTCAKQEMEAEMERQRILKAAQKDLF